MTKMIDLKFNYPDIYPLLEDINPIQAGTFLGGCGQSHKNYNCVYITNITRNPSKPASKTDEDIKTLGTVSKGQNINSISNSRRIYINGILVPGERNTTTICW
ncbi:MAG: hypothetical protein KME23_23070 [Goleter apudmare HA4340-LM2]|jgi:hypothetical protein|nr:hypothetical protein [Goleter apudmare HA4340-LM2]